MTIIMRKFAFQGAVGAFSHSAGRLFASRLGNAKHAVFQPCRSFDEVFERVVSGASAFGIIPLENSSIGSIAANFDLLWSKEIALVGEVSMAIHHQLIGLPDSDLAKLTDVYSHPAALDQCRKFFDRSPHLRPVAFFDTSGAALFVKEKNDPTSAAIASDIAARENGLTILEWDIEDYKENRTRFGIIANLDFNPDSPREIPDPPYKISCVAELPHQPGSLATLLQRLASLNINLTKIESRPIPEAAWHYRFFVDMELDTPAKDAHVVRILKTSCESYKILGRYSPWSDTVAGAGEPAGQRPIV